MIISIILENKATNPNPVRVLNIAFNFCFRRVTKAGYRYKRSEYGARGIAEYWIVDPQINAVTVLILVDGFYEETRFVGNSAIASTIFPDLQLTVEQILNAGESNISNR